MKTPLYLRIINWMQTDFRCLYLIGGVVCLIMCMLNLIQTFSTLVSVIISAAIIALGAIWIEYFRYRGPHIINWHNVLAALIPSVIVFIVTLMAAVL